jgi:hypothetical protein
MGAESSSAAVAPALDPSRTLSRARLCSGDVGGFDECEKEHLLRGGPVPDNPLLDESLERRWRDAGKVALKQHRGRGICGFCHDVLFNDFNTFVADVKLSNGRFYYEVHVVRLQGAVQFGVCSDGFEAAADHSGKGVGHDSFSFAVDGVRQLKWPGDAYGSKWADGQVIGFAIDIRKEGCGRMSVSVDGSFAAPDGLAFDAIPAAWLSPAFSASFGRFRINFGDSPFKHYPPDGFYLSVHQALCNSNAAAPLSAIFQTPFTLNYTDQLTGRRVPISLLANGNLLLPAELRMSIIRPLQLIRADAWFLEQRSPPGCKRRRQQPPFPLDFTSSEYYLLLPARFMFSIVAATCQRLATASANAQAIHRTRRWFECVIGKVTRGRVRKVQVRLLRRACSQISRALCAFTRSAAIAGYFSGILFRITAAASTLPQTHSCCLQAAAAARVAENRHPNLMYKYKLGNHEPSHSICYSAHHGDGVSVLCHLIADADCINKPLDSSYS